MLRLEIRNSQQAPISGVVLRILRSSPRSAEEETITNDARGLAWITYGTNLSHLNIQTQLEGQADIQLFWDLSQGEIPPGEYRLNLQPGILLGGQIQDSDGAPVGGASVQLLNLSQGGVDRQGPQSLFPTVILETDSAGNWKTCRITESALPGLLFAVSHSNFSGMGIRFPLRQPEENAQVREGVWTVRLSSANSAHGIITDPERQPVANALVSTTLSPSACSNCPQTRTDSEGRFVLTGVPKGASSLFAIGEGYPAATATLVDTKLEDIRIVLRPGRPLKIRVINPAGTGIEGASISLQLADTDDTLPDSSLKTDADGWATWENVPRLPLVAHIFAPRYEVLVMEPIRDVESGQRIQLNPLRTFHGTVTDEATGEVVLGFQIEAGKYRDLSPHGTWDVNWSLERPRRFREGHYRFELNEPSDPGESKEFVLRCTAPGYAPSLSPSFGSTVSGLELNFKLQRVEPLERWVVDAAGEPVAHATVAPLSPQSHVALVNGLLQVKNSEDVLLRTDESGRVTIPFCRSVGRVVVAAPAGFALISARDLRAQSTLTLEPWGRIEGHVGDLSTTPISFMGLSDGETFSLKPNLGTADSEALVDSNGNFTFTKVPAGNHSLFLGYRRDGSQSSRYFQKVLVSPGQTIRVDLTSARRTVLAHVRWNEAIPEGVRTRAFARLTEARFVDQPDGPFRGHHRRYGTKIQPDGSAQFLDIPAGDYRLSVHLNSLNLQPPFARIAEGITPILVPEEASEEPIDVGVIPVGTAFAP